MSELWRELGGYQEMVDAGVDMVVAEARIKYLDALRFDDEFEIRATITRLGRTSMSTGIALDRSGTTVAEGELRHVFTESGGGETAPIPDQIRAGLERYSERADLAGPGWRCRLPRRATALSVAPRRPAPRPRPAPACSGSLG